MTIFERQPVAASAIEAPETIQGDVSRILGKCIETETGDPAAGDHLVGDCSERNAMSYGGPASARRMTKIVATVRAQSAKVVGITGPRRGIGVSVASRELARALASFGSPTLLVDLSQVNIVEQIDAEPAAGAALLAMAAHVFPQLEVVSFGGDAGHDTISGSSLRAGIREAVSKGYTVVLDLPPVLEASGGPTASLVATGEVCDLVFLVSLSGEVKNKELAACVEASRTIGLKLGGLILNDWRMPVSKLIES